METPVKRMGIIHSLMIDKKQEMDLGAYSFSDHIAFDQLALAIERNFLLHVTAALNMTVVGMAMLRFFSTHPHDIYVVFGGVFFLIGFAVFIKGLRGWLHMRRVLGRIPDSLKD